MAQVAQRRFIILNLFETFFVNCLDGQDEHGLSFIAPAVVSGFFIFFSKVWHIFLSLIVKLPLYPRATALSSPACGLKLAASRLALVSGFPEAWSLKLGAIDIYPGAKLLPGITHDLELSCDGLQLAW